VLKSTGKLLSFRVKWEIMYDFHLGWFTTIVRVKKKRLPPRH